MVLIKSISGIRGTIGGKSGDSLSPLDVVRFTVAFIKWVKNQNKISRTIVIGRDARISGPMISNIVSSTIISSGLDVLDLGLSTTPTVEMAVSLEKASGGIIITASHNPKNWNALKLLNNKGEFISASDGKEILKFADEDHFFFEEVNNLGSYKKNDSYYDIHLDKILRLTLVNQEAIQNSNFKIVVDGVNSTGGIVVPMLLEKLGVECIKLYCEANGEFPHNPEPLPENLTEISKQVKNHKADLGIVVDPDVDRLAFICEDGSMFGEEYTLVAISDYVLSSYYGVGNTVSNLSSTKALKDITEYYGGNYTASAVGEVNVVEQMKQTDAIIGGEGNGGIIYPELHYGRDALVGIALFLSHLAEKKIRCSELRKKYPSYFISKTKITLNSGIELNTIFDSLKKQYKNEKLNTIDGLKIEFDNEWIHLRRSNTEPIIRIYAESRSEEMANALTEKVINAIKLITK